MVTPILPSQHASSEFSMWAVWSPVQVTLHVFGLKTTGHGTMSEKILTPDKRDREPKPCPSHCEATVPAAEYGKTIKWVSKLGVAKAGVVFSLILLSETAKALRRDFSTVSN